MNYQDFHDGHGANGHAGNHGDAGIGQGDILQVLCPVCHSEDVGIVRTRATLLSPGEGLGGGVNAGIDMFCGAGHTFTLFVQDQQGNTCLWWQRGNDIDVGELTGRPGGQGGGDA